MPAKFQLHEFDLPESAAGQRLDQALVAQLPQYSRARLQRWIASGAVQLTGRKARASERLWGGEHVAVRAEFLADETVAAEAMALRIVHEDAAILVIDKHLVGMRREPSRVTRLADDIPGKFFPHRGKEVDGDVCVKSEAWRHLDQDRPELLGQFLNFRKKLR